MSSPECKSRRECNGKGRPPWCINMVVMSGSLVFGEGRGERMIMFFWEIGVMFVCRFFSSCGKYFSKIVVVSHLMIL